MKDDLKEIKLLLVALAEYLQTTLSAAQIKLYAHDLSDLGPEGVTHAISLLMADPEVWSGRFPLPAKIRSYLEADVKTRAVEATTRVMAVSSVSSAFKELTKFELGVAGQYGLETIVNRQSASSPTIFAHLRDMFLMEYIKQDKLKATLRARTMIGTKDLLALPQKEQTLIEE